MNSTHLRLLPTIPTHISHSSALRFLFVVCKAVKHVLPDVSICLPFVRSAIDLGLRPFPSASSSACRLDLQDNNSRESADTHSVTSARYTAALGSFFNGCCSRSNHSSRTMPHSSSGPYGWMVTCLPGRRALTC